MPTYKILRDRLEGHLAAAKSIDRRTEDEGGRDFTPAEATELQGHIDAVRDLTPQVKMARADERVKAQLRSLGPDVAPGGMPGPSIGSLYGGYAPPSGFKATSSAWAQRVAGQLAKTQQASGVKDLGGGALDVPNVVEVAVQIPARPARLLDLVPTRDLPGNVFAYAKQTVRQSNAGPVADHEQKPTSQYSFTEVQDRARVFAHLSERLSLRYLDDFNELMTVLDVQMYEDLRRSIEDNIAAGDGTGENFVGLLNTSGVYATQFETSLPATLRAARTTLEVASETPNAWLMSPADISTLDLLTDQQGRFYGLEIDKIMGGLPKVPSTAIPPGRAILGDWSMARLFVRENAGLTIDRGGELFAKNELIFRVEGRFGFGVLRPSAFNIVDLTP